MIYSLRYSALAGLFALSALAPLRAAHSPSRRPAYTAAWLQAKMASVAQATHGPIGAAATVVEGSPLVTLNGNRRFPMQSVYKLTIVLAVLHQVDAGRLKMDQSIYVGPNDLMPPGRYSPLRDKYPQGVRLTISALLAAMMSVSDNTASDVLLRLVGGPAYVTSYLRGLGVHDIVVATSEREIGQSEMVQYRNWATPKAMVHLLCLVEQGKGLLPPSRHFLLSLMAASKTGPHQIKGLLPAGTTVAHKTGSSGTINGLTRATNDAGLITLPDGRHLAVVVFVSDTKADTATREAVIAQIARAAWDCRVSLERDGRKRPRG